MKEYIKLNNEVMQKVDGFYQLEKDKLAVEEFQKEVVEKYYPFETHEQRMMWLINNGYYINFLNMYDMFFIVELTKHIYLYEFKFQSYMAISKFYQSYALKTNDKKHYLETYEERIVACALYLAQGDEDYAWKLAESMIKQEYQPATPTFMNTGKARGGEMVSCFKGDAMVMVNGGKHTPISSVGSGDLVVTHDGSLKEVIGIKESVYSDTFYSLKLVGDYRKLEATKEHPVLGVKANDITCVRDKHRLCNENRVSRSNCKKQQRQNKTDCLYLTEGISNVVKWYNIKDLKIGDYVVITTNKTINNICQIDVLNYISHLYNVSDCKEFIVSKEVEFYNVKAKTVISYDREVSKVKRHIPINESFGRLIGYYLSEGHVQKSNEKLKGVTFTINTKDKYIIEDIQQTSLNIFGVEAKIKENKDGSTNVMLNSGVIAELFISLFGTMFNKKTIPTFLMEANLDFQKGIVVGIFRGDGYTISHGMGLDLTNKQLILDIYNILLRLDIVPMVRKYASQSGNDTYSIRIGKYDEVHSNLILEINKDLHKLNNKITTNRWFIKRDGYVLRRIEEVETYFLEEPVFNLEVRDNHTYIVDNNVVHNCFLLEMDDSLNSINYNMNTMGQLSKIGGGVACNLSKLRARGEAIKEVDGASSGIVPVMKLMEDTFSYVNQLGQRAGAGVAYLNIFHWDIEEFLSTKKISGDEKSRLQTLSIGVVIPDKFVELARENKPMYVFAPYTVYKQYGEHLDDLDIDKVYDDLVANPNVKKRQLDPRQLLTNIARTQFESGYPYIMYRSNANRAHALKELGDIKISNLCCEIMQLQETSKINDYGVEDVIKRDISCNLGSLNIANVMENKSIEQSVKTAMKALTSVSDMSNIANAPGVRKANEELHAVGLGAMNLHGYLAKNKIAYESKYAKDFVRTFFMMVNFYSILASVEIAMEKKEVFKGFHESEYANGNYFKKYLENDYAPTTKKVQKLFEGINIPTQKDWEKLAVLVSRHGMYHAYRLAIAPTQSIGYVQNATPSIAPIVSTVETRTYGDSTTYYPMPYLSKSNFFFYQSAYDMDMMKVIDLFAEAQEHIDQGISLVLYVDSETPTSQLVRYYMYAHHKGLKSLYYTRTRLLSATECESCSV